MNSTAGFLISMIGGLLDFASGSSVLLNGTGLVPMGMLYGLSSLEWASGLFLLGGVAIVTGVFSVMMVAIRHRRTVSAVMVACGVLMLLTGLTMTSGAQSLMGGMTFYGYSMIAVGVIMMANAAVSARGPSM